jgi:hypothetical protein
MYNPFMEIVFAALDKSLHKKIIPLIKSLNNSSAFDDESLETEYKILDIVGEEAKVKTFFHVKEKDTTAFIRLREYMRYKFSDGILNQFEEKEILEGKELEILYEDFNNIISKPDFYELKSLEDNPISSLELNQGWLDRETYEEVIKKISRIFEYAIKNNLSVLNFTGGEV